MIPLLLTIWFTASILPFVLLYALRQTRQHGPRRDADLNRVVADFRKGRRAFHWSVR